MLRYSEPEPALRRAKLSEIHSSTRLRSHRQDDEMDPARVQRLHNEPAMVTRPSKRTTGGSAMQVTRIGMDIAKQIFDLHGVDRRRKLVLRRTVRRERLLELLVQLKPCVIGMEACGGAHYWHREISRLGHTVR